MTVVHPRSEWTDRQVNVPTPQREVAHVFVHHEGGPVRGNPTDKPAVLRSIEAYVIPKGYSAIDYNLMVFQDGSIWEGRGLFDEDAATLGWNAKSVSICAVGNFEKEDPTPALQAGIAEAVRWARDTEWLASTVHVLGHRDSGFATACPGSRLYARLPEIRALILHPDSEEEMNERQEDTLNEMAIRVAKIEEFLKNFQAGWSQDSPKLVNWKAIGARCHAAARKALGQ
jgi:N-acetylmuramoyl-L-alanine amidase